MQNLNEVLPQPSLTDQQITEYYEGIISYIRSRLNVISASVYLLESGNYLDNGSEKKYLLKIDQELESIRKLLNE